MQKAIWNDAILAESDKTVQHVIDDPRGCHIQVSIRFGSTFQDQPDDEVIIEYIGTTSVALDIVDHHHRIGMPFPPIRPGRHLRG